MRYEIWLGLRYLLAKRRERMVSIISALAIGGVALGVMALVIVLPIMSGFQRDLKEKLVGINAHLVIDAPRGLEGVHELMRVLSATEHVVGVSPFVSGQAILQYDDRSTGVVIRGMDLERETRVTRLAEYLELGTFPQTDDEVVIGRELSAQMGIWPGTRIRLISPADGRTHDLLVSGIFRSGMYEYDVSLVGLTLARAQALYQLGDVVSGVGVKLEDLDLATTVQPAVQARLGPGVTVKTWMDLYPTLFGAIRMEKTLMFLLLLLIVVVATLNIASMLIMIVIEKTKDIGILRALGARRRSIALLFLTQGCTVAFVGVCCGLLLGLSTVLHINEIVDWLEGTFGVSLFPPSVYFFDQIPVQVSPSDVVAVVACVALLAVLAGTYPAIRAANLSPTEALRYE